MRLAALALIVLTLEGGGSGGLSLRELPKATLHSIGLGYGLGVVKLGAAGERAGLRIGDVIDGSRRRAASGNHAAAAFYRYSSAHLMISTLLARSRQWRASWWRRDVFAIAVPFFA